MALFTLLLVVVKSAEMKASKGKKGERKGKKKMIGKLEKIEWPGMVGCFNCECIISGQGYYYSTVLTVQVPLNRVCGKADAVEFWIMMQWFFEDVYVNYLNRFHFSALLSSTLCEAG